MMHAKDVQVSNNSPDKLMHQPAGNKALPAEEILYDLADLFRMFSDTTRIKLLYALMSCERSVSDLAEVTGSSQSAVSHQLRTLRQAHLVRYRREGRNILYSLADGHVATILDQGMSHVLEPHANRASAADFLARDTLQALPYAHVSAQATQSLMHAS
ncbi:metalloregulator ArsR/SmtB family transcription factor [Collinsella sp. zg1085]|nr:metalloregulator ArsR/SmtB family transcription factor [Collinsella sp. zg1085]